MSGLTWKKCIYKYNEIKCSTALFVHDRVVLFFYPPTHVFVVAGEETAGTGNAGLDLVGHEEDVVLVTDALALAEVALVLVGMMCAFKWVSCDVRVL